jgi:hypothetical protein
MSEKGIQEVEVVWANGIQSQSGATRNGAHLSQSKGPGCTEGLISSKAAKIFAGECGAQHMSYVLIASGLGRGRNVYGTGLQQIALTSQISNRWCNFAALQIDWWY